MGKPLPLFMTLVPHGGLTWYSPKGARLLSNRDSRKLAKAFKYGLPHLTPRVVDKYAARLFVLAVEQIALLCATATTTTPSPEWFWCTVGERLAWCRKLADPALLVKFVHTCMCAQTMYAQTDARQRCPAAARLSELAVAVWRFKVAVAETLDDVMARQLFVPPGVFSLNPKAEGPVAKRLVKRPMRRRHQARKSLKAYEDASRRIEQDEPAKVQEVRGDTTNAVDAVGMDIDEAPETEAIPIQSPVHVQSPVRVPSPAPIRPSVREPLVGIESMDSAKLQAMQLSQKLHQDDDEELYYEIVECDADDSDEENPEIDYEDSDSDEEGEDSDADSFYEGEDYDDDNEEDYDDVMGGVEY
ncbi:hypothetical protein F4809DRAFT_657666 [Biscogniauxia mediterranea]|nr:hypothetical protein F4809DRAFT_657666 [Biscogniauxia mediterranea]